MGESAQLTMPLQTHIVKKTQNSTIILKPAKEQGSHDSRERPRGTAETDPQKNYPPPPTMSLLSVALVRLILR